MVQPVPEPHLVKRHGPSRLYDTNTLSYVDDAQLQALVSQGVTVTVVDAESGQDVTADLLRGGT